MLQTLNIILCVVNLVVCFINLGGQEGKRMAYFVASCGWFVALINGAF